MTVCASWSYDVWGLHKARSEWKCRCHLRSHEQNCALHRGGVLCLSSWVTPCLAMMPVPVAFQSPYKDVEYRLVVPNSRFALDPSTGIISVKADLTRDTDSSFTVRILDLFFKVHGATLPLPPTTPFQDKVQERFCLSHVEHYLLLSQAWGSLSFIQGSHGTFSMSLLHP